MQGIDQIDLRHDQDTDLGVIKTVITRLLHKHKLHPGHVKQSKSVVEFVTITLVIGYSYIKMFG